MLVIINNMRLEQQYNIINNTRLNTRLRQQHHQHIINTRLRQQHHQHEAETTTSSSYGNRMRQVQQQHFVVL
jgi:3'-phosphoadenosine 5'-phosphosulfate sulfotransferase